jgi:micrococcal nuclease
MYEYAADVVQVHDGDTMRFNVDLGFDIHHASLDVRLAGIDCPELGRPDHLGEDARQFVLTWFQDNPGPYVLRTIKDHTEKYGRYLATVQAMDMPLRWLIIDLLTAGLAKHYDGHGPRPTWP